MRRPGQRIFRQFLYVEHGERSQQDCDLLLSGNFDQEGKLAAGAVLPNDDKCRSCSPKDAAEHMLPGSKLTKIMGTIEEINRQRLQNGRRRGWLAIRHRFDRAHCGDTGHTRAGRLVVHDAQGVHPAMPVVEHGLGILGEPAIRRFDEKEHHAAIDAVADGVRRPQQLGQFAIFKNPNEDRPRFGTHVRASSPR